MDELKTVISTLTETIIGLAVRAAKAEELAETYRVNMVNQQEEHMFWLNAYNRKDKQAEELKAEIERLRGEQNGKV